MAFGGAATQVESEPSFVATVFRPEMNVVMKEILGRVSGGEDLSMDEMSDVIDSIMQGQASEEEIAMLLTALRVKGETVEEVAGAAAAMRKHMTPIKSNHADLVDTCGTGGSGSGTFNISTAAAIVAAGADVKIAKHGNRAMSSKTGSADVLAELGVNIEASVETVEKCLDEVGICFCFAQLMHRSMKHVAPVRKKLGVPTIFNLLGPLCNPAGAPYQVLGVGRPDIIDLISGALARLGSKRAVVVHGEDAMCEVTLGGKTDVRLIDQDSIETQTWTPADFGMSTAAKDSLLADGPAASAAIIRDILAGKAGPHRDVVVMNAAAAIWLAGREESLDQSAAKAADSIDTGAAREKLAWLAEVSN